MVDISSDNIIDEYNTLLKELSNHSKKLIKKPKLLLITKSDLVSKNLTGKTIEILLDQAKITVNKNTVPGDPQSPFVTSGLRIGTPAVTTRGFKQAECEQLSHWMCDIMDKPDDAAVLQRVRDEVAALCQQFPVYQD